MKHKFFSVLCLLLLTGMVSQARSQTKCVWMVRSENGTVVQKAGISIHLLKLLAKSGGNWDINGMKMTFDTLLTIYESGSTTRIKDSTGEGETKVFAGKFDERMKEESERHNLLVVESTDSRDTMKVSKIRVESVEAVGIVLAMIGSKNLDADIDGLESALRRGGVLYMRDYKDDSRIWIYVN